MIKITDEMGKSINNALANGTPCILATASPKGEPSLGFRGSMMVYDGESLAYWERAKRAGLEHIEANPKVVVLYRDPITHLAWKFHGEATIYRDGLIRDHVMARVVQPELDRDPDRTGYAVIIRLNSVLTMGGDVVQQREPSL
ncbi:pyridoxamine 5'-phosphate oxidase family protein [Dehalococcoidia bacterium]|nr:pyridoxamine 5'-phosphate oxidase family protein [Dehalococcoidia bacterium]